MFAFLKAHYEREPSDDIGAILGSLSLLQDGRPADPACAKDWEEAVVATLGGAADANLRFVQK